MSRIWSHYASITADWQSKHGISRVLNTPEWYLVPEAAFALIPLPLVIQYRLKARRLSICPSQRIYVQASRPGLNKIPFQLVQLFANHKTNSYVDRTFTAKRKAN